MRTVAFLFALFVVFLLTCVDTVAAEGEEGPEVLYTREGDRECWTVTFEGIGHLAEVPYIPDPGITFSVPSASGEGGWIVLTCGLYNNNPSGAGVTLWLGAASARIDFDLPMSAVSFTYSSRVDIALEAFDDEGNILASATGPDTAPRRTFEVWFGLGVDIGANAISTITVFGSSGQTVLDDLRVYRVMDPADMTAGLIGDVEGLELPAGLENALVAKLGNAIDSMDRDVPAAANQLEAFINLVEAQAGKKIPLEEAVALVSAVQGILEMLG